MTEHGELAGNCLDRRRKKRSSVVAAKGHQRFMMLMCSGLHIASKYWPTESEFVAFKDYGSIFMDCPSNCFLPNLFTPNPFTTQALFVDYECMVRKGVGRVRFDYPLDDKSNITVDVFNIHTQSDEKFTGEERKRRLNQLNQVLPAIEKSDADLVLLGGDFNDYQGTSVYQRMTKLLVDPALQKYNQSYYFQNTDFHTYGNRHNYYSYTTKKDYKRTLDYILYRKPKKKFNFR